MNLAIILGKHERYVFSLEEFLEKDLLENGPQSLYCWKVHPRNPNFQYNRSSRKDWPEDNEIGEGCTLEMVRESRDIRLGVLYRLFTAIDKRPLDWDTSVEITFHLDDETSNLYTWQDNFNANEWWWETSFPERKRNIGKTLFRNLNIKPSSTLIHYN